MSHRGEDTVDAPETADGATPDADGVRWLTDEERSAWLATAAVIFTLPAALDSRLQAEANLTFFEYMVLAVLSEREDRTMQMSEIAAGLSSSLSRLSHVITRLERQALVCRSRVPGAGRRTHVTLTDEGWERVRTAAPGHVRSVREYFVDALEPSDLPVLQRLGADVAQRVNPARPFLHGVSPSTDVARASGVPSSRASRRGGR